MFETVLVANRGEIAVRVISTLRRMGVRSVAVYSDADRDARHVREADLAVRIGPALASESYLSIDRILEAAGRSNAQAVHPGYGFLSENAAFVRACEGAGLVFVGPGADVVEMMGDKIRAKQAVALAGVPVVPGRTEPAMTNDDLVAAAREIGFPVLVKPSAGGGGKGMRLATSPDELVDALASARREAQAYFADDTLFLERFVVSPRHIEVQVLADANGTTVHLGERECSLQRRHQKVIEEAPSTLLDSGTRSRITASAVTTARAVGYRGVGTVEFIVSADAPDEFFFMEMNTRLQVEHPVTEMITGLDLVEQQLRVAAGEGLTFTQEEVRFEGHAVEARVYAEDPAHGFLPTGGRVELLREPVGEGVRMDSSLLEGIEVTSHYDPMLAKVIAYGPDRRTALERLDRALADTVVLGVGTNVAFLRSLVATPGVRAGRIDTGLIERELDSLIHGGTLSPRLPLETCAAFALQRLREIESAGRPGDRWDVPDGWRVGEHAPARWSLLSADERPVDIALTGTTGDASIVVERVDRHGEPSSIRATCSLSSDWGQGAHEIMVTVDGCGERAIVVSSGGVTWVWINGATHALRVRSRTRVSGSVDGRDGEVRSPMPGVVIELNVELGQRVEAGDRLIVIEAMKMENALLAPFTGSLTEVLVSAGDRVLVNQPLLRVEPDPDDASSTGGEESR